MELVTTFANLGRALLTCKFQGRGEGKILAKRGRCPPSPLNEALHSPFHVKYCIHASVWEVLLIHYWHIEGCAHMYMYTHAYVPT